MTPKERVELVPQAEKQTPLESGECMYVLLLLLRLAGRTQQCKSISTAHRQACLVIEQRHDSVA